MSKMPGRAYTQREMKQIVDYLVDHRAYSEIRGRKMWVDMANSKVIDRTWQSLKETFLKRILPDIHNPYYKLSVEQIASFRQEHDVAERSKNKLEIYNSDDTSNKSGKHQAGKAVEIENQKSGENQCSKIKNRTRSSTETLVLENCDANDSENDVHSGKSEKTTKSLRDLITYSEPLTPMLQELVNDFTSDDEPPMQIVEEVEPPHNGITENKKSASPVTIRESQSYNKVTEKSNDEDVDKNTQSSSKIKSLKLKKTHKGTWENKEPVKNSAVTAQDIETNNNESEEVFSGKEKEKRVSRNSRGTAENNATVDSQLPNNQEALVDKPQTLRTSTEVSDSDLTETRKKKKGKRSRSESQNRAEHKKKKKDKHRTRPDSMEEIKETQTFDSHPGAAALQKELSKDVVVTQNTQEIKQGENATIQTNTSDDTNIPPNVTAVNSTNSTSQGTSQEAGPSGVDIENPCLKPVSLYAEQFSQSKLSDSEFEETNEKDDSNNKKIAVISVDKIEGNDLEKVVKDSETNVVEKTINEKSLERSQENLPKEKDNKTVEKSTSSVYESMIKQKTEKVVLLNSHTDDSDSEDFEQPKKITRVEKSRAKALSNAFGFSSGTISKKQTVIHRRSKTLSYRHRRISGNKPIVLDSEKSDDYTTASESDEGTSSSCAHQNKSKRRRHVQTKCYDILKHPNSGASFVAVKKRLYPILTEDGNSLRYAVREMREAAADSTWKEMYLQERKKCFEEKLRADELSRLLKEAKQQQQQMEEPISPILQPKVNLCSTLVKKDNLALEAPGPSAEPEKKNNVKAKINQNKEIELEGKGTELAPLLEKMLAMLCNNEARAESKKELKEVEELKSSKEKERFEKIILMLNNNEAKTDKKEIKEDLGAEAQKSSKNDEKSQNRKSDDNTAEKTETKEPTVKENGVENVENKDTRPSQRPVEVIEIEEKTTEKAKKLNVNKRLSQSSKRNASSEPEVISSGKSTPVPFVVSQADPEVRDKVDKIEKEIFKAIEEIDKSDQSIKQNGDVSDTNITKRKRSRPKKTASLSSATSSEGVPKEESAAKKPRAGSRQREVDESDASTSKRATKPPKSGDDKSTVNTEKPNTRKKLSLNNKTDSTVNVEVPDDDDSVRYKLPPRGKAKTDQLSKRYLASNTAHSPDNSSRNSQGYQESDISNSPKFVTKRKRKLSTSDLLNKRGRIGKVKRRSSPYLADDSCSNETLSQRSETHESGSSEIYRSESYQLLLPKTKQVNVMDKIEETRNCIDTEDVKQNVKSFTPLTVQVNNDFYVASQELNLNELQLNSEQSSEISLPLSPELSVVENLSISTEAMSVSPQDHPTINEMQRNNESQSAVPNKYLISDVDVTMPLMQQNFEVHPKRSRAMSESAEKIVSTTNNNQTLSDTLGQKLRDLLLESAKKIEQDNLASPNPMKMEVDNVVQSVKIKNKRRSSTPRKRTTLPKSKTPTVEPVLEEHTETCSYNGRKSCPPVIIVSPCEEETLTVVYDDEVDINDNVNKKGRGKKKDVIKVKILRPRRKSHSSKGASTKRVSAVKKVSAVCTDSGINDTGSIISECRCCNEADELIHNHSDTCLHMEECVGDSIEILENPSTTVISVNSETSSSSLTTEKQKVKHSSENFVTPEGFCTNAQDGANLNVAKTSEGGDSETVYFTPPEKSENGSFDSLLTEDLSDEAPTVAPSKNFSKWYLLSEDETNFQDAQSQSSQSGVGSNLKQIFPVTCAVPDLSTITEMSKENDSKPAMNTDSEMETFSQSIFEFNL